MSTKWIIVFFLIFASICSYAQPKEYFDLPPSIPKPSWFNQIDWKNINVFRSDSIVQKYKEEERSKNPNKKEEFEEDPYLTAYRRWRMNIQPYIKPDGGLDLSPKKIQIRSSSIKLQGLSAGSWTCMGPVETFEGEDPNRSGKARDRQVNIYTLAIDPNNSNTLYCGSETGIIFKSPDKGLHWTSVSDQLTLPGAPTAIAIAKKTPNTIFCYAGQLIKSSDGGTTWSQVTTYPGNGSEAIKINPTTDRIYVASREGSTQLGVYISDNKGQTWSIANGTSGIAIDDIAINPANNNIVYAVGKNSSQGLVLFTSTDGGTNFTNTTGSLSMINKGARIGITPANGNILYCIVLSNSNPTVLLKSTNAGQTWSTHVSSKCASWTGCNTNGVGLGMGGGQGFYDLAILVSTQDANKIIVGDSSSFISTDGGSNFTGLGSYVGSWPMHPDYQSMAMDGNDTFIANDGGIIYSSDFFTNKANFDSRNNGLTGSPFWGFSQGWDEDLVVGGRYHNGNVSLFEQSGSGGSMALGGAEDDTGHVLHGYSMTAAFHDIGTKVVPSTLNGTATVANIQNTQWPNSDNYGAFSSRLVTDPRYRTIFYLGGDKDLAAKNTTLWKSINSGQSYTSLHTFPSKVWRFDISRSNPKILFVCTTDGVYKTSDAGNTWANITQNIGVTYAYYNSDIVIDPSNANTIFLAMAKGNNQNKVFRSTDGGDSWTNYTGAGLAGLSVAFLQADGTKEGIYAITKNNPTQVFYRNSTMTDWINFSNGIPANFQIWPGTAIFFRDDKIRIAGNRGVWESPLYAHPNPIAQPMASAQSINCGQTVYFNDYSILNYKGVNLNSKPASWQWSIPGATYMNGTNNASQKPQVIYTAAGSYSVTLTVMDGLGLSSTKTVPNMISVTQGQVACNGCLPPTITPSGPTAFCQGGSVTLTASSANNYLWSNGKTTQSIVVTSAGSYSVTISNVGCSATSNPIMVTINPPPSMPTITPSGPTTICQGGSVTLTASSANNYLWSDGKSTQSIVANSTGSYSVIINNGGCSATSNPITVIVNPYPSTPTISVNEAVLTSSSTDGNQWYLDGSIISGATSQDYTMTTLGTYTVVVTNDNGCSASSIPYNTTDDDFIIYPNPNDGQFRIQKPATMQIIELKIYNMFGHLMYQSKTGETNLNLQGLNGGAYVLEIKTGGKTYKAKKFIVQ